MIRNTWSNRQLVYCPHKPVVRLESVDAIRHALQRADAGICDEKWFDRRVDRVERWRRFDHTGADAADPAPSQIAAAMRSRNKDYTLNVGSMVKNKHIFNNFFCLRRQR